MNWRNHICCCRLLERQWPGSALNLGTILVGDIVNDHKTRGRMNMAKAEGQVRRKKKDSKGR